MFRPEVINYLAVVVAAIAHQLIGLAWYGALFGRMWMEARGVRREDLSANATRSLIVSTLAALVMSFAFALLLTAVNGIDLGKGLEWGLVLGAGFVGATAVINGAYEDRSTKVTGLFVGYEIVALAVMGAILGAWR